MGQCQRDWRSNYTDSNKSQQHRIDNTYATGTSLKVCTIQNNQYPLYDLLQNRMARLSLTCNNGARGCMMIQFGSAPGMSQNIEKPSVCPK
jgi:hypothetical protein